MRDKLIYEEYSSDKEYMFEVYKNSNDYEVWVQKKAAEDCMDEESFYYLDIPDYSHRADTLKRAIEIGRECLKCLNG